MKAITIGLLACFVAAFTAAAAEAEWLTDLSKAQAKAKAENKLVLMDFTGSDWCPPCKALHKNVFAAEEFAAYAKDNLVLVEVDFPHNKAQSAELKKSNEALSEQFNIEGFPTVVVLSPDGRQLHKTSGYNPGQSAADFIAHVKKLKK